MKGPLGCGNQRYGRILFAHFGQTTREGNGGQRTLVCLNYFGLASLATQAVAGLLGSTGIRAWQKDEELISVVARNQSLLTYAFSQSP